MMNSLNKPAKLRILLFGLCSSLGLATLTLAHPLPDIPVRTYFSADGAMEIRVEIDPRAFEMDPEAESYLIKGLVDRMTKEETRQLHDQAAKFVKERLTFVCKPKGKVQPKFEWSWRRLGDEADLQEVSDEAVLVGSWKPKFTDGFDAYRIKALNLDSEKMGIALNVVFVNYIDRKKAERYAVLFPGEQSFEVDENGLSLKSDSAQK